MIYFAWLRNHNGLDSKWLKVRAKDHQQAAKIATGRMDPRQFCVASILTGSEMKDFDPEVYAQKRGRPCINDPKRTE